jgi:hypothetical protein
MQTRNLFWSSVTTPIPNGSFTYLRIRLTKSVWGMDNTKATGYYEDGETEDYRVLVDDFPLSVDLISFQARVVQEDHVQLEWKTTNEENMTDYVVERSSDNQNWQTLGTMNPTGNGSGGINNYTYDDHGPLRGRSFYRIRMLSGTGDIRFSEVRWVMIGKSLGDIVLSPNPAGDNINISLYASSDATGVITITDISGKVVYKQPAAINKGANTIGIPIARQLPDGMYVVQVSINDETTAEKLVIQHGK